MLLIKKSIVAVMAILPLIGIADTSKLAPRTFVYHDRLYTYDEAMKMKTPPVGIKVVTDDTECKKRLEKIVPVSGNTFALIHLAENGYSGMAKSWPTASGSIAWDTGKYSINEINWKTFIDQGLNPFQLRWNDCASLIASAYLMGELYESANKQYKQDIIDGKDPWLALKA